MNMKRSIPLGVFLIVLSIQIYAEEPRRFFGKRFFEFGVDADLGAANNFIGAADIFKKNLEMDMTKLGGNVKDGGIKINADVNTEVFINVNAGKDKEAWGFGLSAGVSGGIYGNVPKSILTFLAEGNVKNHSPDGDFTAYGGVFADTTLDVHFKLFKKLRIGIIPSMYIPVVYIPKASIHYSLEAEESLIFGTGGEINVYSPISLEEISMATTDTLLGAIEAKGIDLSLNVEYDLLTSNGRPFFSIGTDITHIPLVPATLNHRMQVTSAFGIDGSKLISGESLEINLDEIITQTYFTDAGYTVVRPLRFDFYGLLRPFKNRLLTLRPNIGFTVLTPSEKPYFNAGADLQLNLINLLVLHIGTGYEETLWKHRAGLALNLRIIELDIEAGLRSQDFVNSFQMNGFSLGIGVRVGF